MAISVTSSMIDVFTIALLMTEFGQVWVEYVCMTSCHSCGENWKVN